MPRTLPLFPLRLVLLPGAAVPLHIFEPRYRQMLHDCLATDRRFGLVLAPDEPLDPPLPAGLAGCVARIDSADPLPDGRSNILVVGETRFTLRRLTDVETPYLVGEVEDLVDAPEDEGAWAELAASVRSHFQRAAQAARTLADDRTPIPALDAPPEALAFQVAALVDFDVDERQALLASTSPRERLARIDVLLRRALPALEERATVHTRAKSNGHGPHPH